MLVCETSLREPNTETKLERAKVEWDKGVKQKVSLPAGRVRAWNYSLVTDSTRPMYLSLAVPFRDTWI